jgi:hypothetical protein
LGAEGPWKVEMESIKRKASKDLYTIALLKISETEGIKTEKRKRRFLMKATILFTFSKI